MEKNNKMVEKIIIKKATDLPFETQKEIGCFKGLVEIRIEKISGAVPKVIPLPGMTFSDRLRQQMKEDGLIGKKFFKE